MKTSSEGPSSLRLLLPVVLSVVAVTLATGCGEPLPSEPEALQQATFEIGDRCPTGTCTSPTNGRGLYISEGLAYCIPISGGKEARSFCPEGFINTSTGGVELRGQRIYDANGFPDVPDMASYAAGGWLKDERVEVVHVDMKDGHLIITVNTNGGAQQLSGSDLDNLALEFPKGTPLFQLQFHPSTPENNIDLYQANYSLTGTKTWQPYCADGTGLAAMLPSRSVHSVTGKVTTAVDGLAMACRTGSIATCMVWGYKPWESEKQQQADYLYGSCLQAKRAAYFVGSGDFHSYTVSGTHIAVQDRYQIMNSLMPGVEAVWSPDGAICFSPQYQRIPNPGSTLPALPSPLPLKPCDVTLDKAAQQGTLPTLLDETAPLVTGPT